MDFVTVTKIHSLTTGQSLNWPQYVWVDRTCICCVDDYRSLKFKAHEIVELMNLTELQIGQSFRNTLHTNLLIIKPMIAILPKNASSNPNAVMIS